MFSSLEVNTVFNVFVNYFLFLGTEVNACMCELVGRVVKNNLMKFWTCQEVCLEKIRHPQTWNQKIYLFPNFNFLKTIYKIPSRFHQGNSTSSKSMSCMFLIFWHGMTPKIALRISLNNLTVDWSWHQISHVTWHENSF